MSHLWPIWLTKKSGTFQPIPGQYGNRKLRHYILTPPWNIIYFNNKITCRDDFKKYDKKWLLLWLLLWWWWLLLSFGGEFLICLLNLKGGIHELWLIFTSPLMLMPTSSTLASEVRSFKYHSTEFYEQVFNTTVHKIKFVPKKYNVSIQVWIRLQIPIKRIISPGH